MKYRVTNLRPVNIGFPIDGTTVVFAPHVPTLIDAKDYEICHFAGESWRVEKLEESKEETKESPKTTEGSPDKPSKEEIKKVKREMSPEAKEKARIGREKYWAEQRAKKALEQAK